jgi:hypothetical protein
MMAAVQDHVALEDTAIGDMAWFDAHPWRRFRAKKNRHGHVWLVRRRQGAPDVFLRTPAKEMPADDTDLAIGTPWYIAAFQLPLDKAGKASRKAIRKAGK